MCYQKALKMACAQKYVMQATKVSENLMHAKASNARAPKTGFFAVFLIQTQFVA